jgi:hypothetical protein
VTITFDLGLEFGVLHFFWAMIIALFHTPFSLFMRNAAQKRFLYDMISRGLSVNIAGYGTRLSNEIPNLGGMDHFYINYRVGFVSIPIV